MGAEVLDSDPPDQPIAPSAADFRDVIGRFATGVTIITAVADGADFGATASAVASLSLEPPMVVVCLNRQSATARASRASGGFAVNILGEDHADLAVRFANRTADKFANVVVMRGRGGEPLLADALATLECRITEEVEGGTHWVFLALVEHAVARGGAPLAYFRGQYGRLELAADENVFGQIRARILSRDIPVGDPLDLNQLAGSLGATRGAVYHALAKLTGEGLVTRDGDGAFLVRPVTVATATDAAHARFAMMLGVAELSVGRVAVAQVAEMRRLAASTRPVYGDGDIAGMAAWVRASRQFLEYQIGLVGSATLLDSFRRASVAAMIVRSLPDRPSLDLREAHQRAHHAYVSLVEAYAAGDTPAAVVALQRILAVVLVMIETMFGEDSEI
jgi:flavin reductase (DIM6/NTAB) family NADH-FMN oxidoreductase RutF/DNA-binding GntR family transcriptional regulator